MEWVSDRSYTKLSLTGGAAEQITSVDAHQDRDTTTKLLDQRPPNNKRILEGRFSQRALLDGLGVAWFFSFRGPRLISAEAHR